MLRYKQLLSHELDRDNPNCTTLRALAGKVGISIPSMHNYVAYDVLPRIENLEKMATYFREPISTLLTEDDDITAKLVTAVRKLPKKQKQQLLRELKK